MLTLNLCFGGGNVKISSTYPILLVFAGLLIFQGCGTSLVFDITEQPQGISKENLKIESSDRSLSWEGIKINVPGNVYYADFDIGRNEVLFNFAADKKVKSKNMLSYDFESDHILWAAKTNANNFMSGNDCVIIEGYGKRQIRSYKDGEFIRTGESYLFLYDGETFVLSPKKYVRLDLLTGDTLWAREGSEWEGYREQYREDDWIYVIAKGIHAFDIESGEGWDFKLSNSHKGHTEALAKNAALACLAGMSGSRSTQTVKAKLYHNQNSAPIFEDDKIYLVSRNKAFCFNSKTGDVVWETILPHEYHGVSGALTDQHLIIIGNGWKYVDFTIQKDNKPSILLLNAKTGEQTGFFELGEDGIVNGFKWLSNNAFLLTSTTLFKISHDLDIVGQREATTEQMEFYRFLKIEDDELIVRTRSGISSFDPASLELNWEKYLGEAPRYDPDKKLRGYWKEGARWYFNRNIEKNRSRRAKGLEWLCSFDGSIMAVDLEKDGEVIMEYDLGTDNFSFDSRGVLGLGEGYFIALPFDKLK